MDFNQVRYFLAIADTLNFTRAAELCHVTQPALTQAIKRLENELGGELIHRDGRNTELSRLGKSLRLHFQQIDRTRQLVKSTARAVSTGEVAELNIGLMCTIGPVALTGILNRFQQQNPMVSLVFHDVTPNTISDLLLSGALDGAFCSRREVNNSLLRVIDLFDEPIVVAFPPDHPFAAMDAVPLHAVAQHRYIDRLHCEFRSDFFQHCDNCDIELDVAFRSQREDWIQSLIRDGMGVSVLPRFSLLRPALDSRPVSEPPMSRKIAFAVVEQPEAAPALAMLLQEINRFDLSLTRDG